MDRRILGLSLLLATAATCAGRLMGVPYCSAIHFPKTFDSQPFFFSWRTG